MSTIDRLLMDAQAAQLRGDTKLAEQIMSEVERMSEAERKRDEWKEQMKAKGANDARDQNHV